MATAPIPLQQRPMTEILAAASGPEAYAPKKPNGNGNKVVTLAEAEENTVSAFCSEVAKLNDSFATQCDNAMTVIDNLKKLKAVQSLALQEAARNDAQSTSQILAALKTVEVAVRDIVDRHLPSKA